jgi:hypothetical protein
MTFCNDTSHGGSRYMERTWTCSHGQCRGIQAWRHHEEETRRELFEEEHRWQRHYGLPLSRVPQGSRFSYQDEFTSRPRRRLRGARAVQPRIRACR